MPETAFIITATSEHPAPLDAGTRSTIWTHGGAGSTIDFLPLCSSDDSGGWAEAFAAAVGRAIVSGRWIQLSAHGDPVSWQGFQERVALLDAGVGMQGLGQSGRGHGAFPTPASPEGICAVSAFRYPFRSFSLLLRPLPASAPMPRPLLGWAAELDWIARLAEAFELAAAPQEAPCLFSCSDFAMASASQALPWWQVHLLATQRRRHCRPEAIETLAATARQSHPGMMPPAQSWRQAAARARREGFLPLAGFCLERARREGGPACRLDACWTLVRGLRQQPGFARALLRALATRGILPSRLRKWETASTESSAG